MNRLKASLCTAVLAMSFPGAAIAVTVQNEPTGTALDQGLWWLYHLKYAEARKLFTLYTEQNPKDPAGYFYKTANDWWQLAQQADRDLPEVRADLEKDYLETVQVAQKLLDSTEDKKIKAQACLYMGGAQGLKGRWLVAQRHWVDAYFMGKKGHKMLKRALEFDPELYDAYMGLGIYDYFTDTLGGVQKVLAALFIRGDRKRGLQELQWSIEKGQHARVEAMMFLIEIYTWEEDTPEKALPYSQALHREFPKSPAMYLAEIIDHYELKNWPTVKTQAQDYLEKSEKEQPHYAKEGIYPAWYCLGIAAFWGDKDVDTCLTYMGKIAENPEKNSRWVTFAYLRMGQVYDVKGEREKAKEYYQKVMSRPNFWGAQTEARNYLKQPFSFKPS